MSPEITIKKGSSFIVSANFSKTNYTDITAENIQSQVRNSSDKLIADLIVSEVAPQIFNLSCNDTSDWPLGMLYMDIIYVLDDFIDSTPTIAIQVKKEVTRL